MDSSHFSSLFDKLDQDRKGDQVYCDVTISVNNKLFPAHRCILGTFCVYFATLFQSSFKDKSNETIKLSGPLGEEIKPRTFQSVLNFCYTKRTDLTKESVYDILAAAEFLQIDRLKDDCVRYLNSLLSASSWLKIYRTALKWRNEHLLESCLDAFLNMKGQIDLREFSFEEFQAVIEHSSSSEMLTKSEEVFEMVSNWIDTQQDDGMKQQHFDELIQFVDFETMQETYVSEKIMTNNLILNSHVALQSLVDLKLEEQANQKKMLWLGGDYQIHCVRKYVESSWKTLRQVIRSAVATNGTHVFVVDGDHAQGCIQVYDIAKDTWSVLENILKESRWASTATIIDSKLYVTGGFMRGSSWTPIDDHGIADLQAPRDEVYFIDRTSKRLFSITEVFNISGSSCTTCDNYGIPDLKVARFDHAIVTKDNEIYFIGGRSSKGVSSSCEAINVLTKEWKELPSLHQARCELSAVINNRSIIAIGGCDENLSCLDSVESFSLDTNQWTVMEPMITPRRGHRATVFEGQIFVLGGQDGSYRDLNHVEIYDSNAKQWQAHSTVTNSRTLAYILNLEYDREKHDLLQSTRAATSHVRKCAFWDL